MTHIRWGRSVGALTALAAFAVSVAVVVAGFAVAAGASVVSGSGAAATATDASASHRVLLNDRLAVEAGGVCGPLVLQGDVRLVRGLVIVAAASALDAILARQAVDVAGEQIGAPGSRALTVRGCVLAEGSVSAFLRRGRCVSVETSLSTCAAAVCDAGHAGQVDLHAQDFSAQTGGAGFSALTGRVHVVVQVAAAVLTLQTSLATSTAADQDGSALFAGLLWDAPGSGACEHGNVGIVVALPNRGEARHQLAGRPQEAACVDVHGGQKRRLRLSEWVAEADLVPGLFAVHLDVRRDGPGGGIVGKNALCNIIAVSHVNQRGVRHGDRFFISDSVALLGDNLGGVGVLFTSQYAGA